MVDGRGYDLKRGCPWVWKAESETAMNTAGVSIMSELRLVSTSYISGSRSFLLGDANSSQSGQQRGN
jgi:hypothetical protein